MGVRTEDLGRIIKGLECCVLHNPDDRPRCADCPFYEAGNCVNQLKYLALDHLRERAPRVISTLELYDAEGTQGYIETRHGIRPCFLVHCRQWPEWCFRKGAKAIERYSMGIMDSQNMKRFWEFRLYGKTWRIWTAKPSDEQRKAERWNDESERD